METATEKLKKSRAFLCLECGKCTAVCPISKYNSSYSPRRLLAEGLFYGAGDLMDVTKEDLKDLLGVKDGIRLHNRLKKQKVPGPNAALLSHLF